MGDAPDPRSGPLAAALAARGSGPQVMGILNLTPDSFSDGGQLLRAGTAAPTVDLGAVIDRAASMVDDGADWLDVGGESTRPGAQPVTVAEELDRVVPVIEALSRRFEVGLSVDTSKPEVMQAAVTVGAGLINDVRALRQPQALAVAAAAGVPVCLMHMRGEPATMQRNPAYRDVVAEVIGFLSERRAACEAAGIPADRIVLDPGFGFGKTLAHNLALLARLGDIVALGSPVLVGLSRKRSIGEITGRGVEVRVHGSTAAALLAVQRGAAIIRVHDVGPTRDALAVLAAVDGAAVRRD